MRRLAFVFLATLGPSCGTPERPTSAELDGLLQRLDAMEERIDELEDAAESQPAQRPPRPPSGLAQGPDGFPPRLPPGPPPPDGAGPSLQVHVRVSGLSVDGKVVTQDDAEKLFREAARKNPATRLAMLSEPDVPHARVVEVMDLARDAGLSSIAISAKFSDDEATSPR